MTLDAADPAALDAWTLTTPRLRLRPAVPADAARIHAIRRHAPYQPQDRDIDDFRAMLTAMRALPIGDEGWQQWMLELQDGTVVGDIGINFGNPCMAQAEVGFSLHPDHQGQGLATEAVGRLADRLLGDQSSGGWGLHRLVAFSDTRNHAAHRLLERLRFRREGLHHASWRSNGAWIDEISFARLAVE